MQIASEAPPQTGETCCFLSGSASLAQYLLPALRAGEIS
jgi:hypothetical protein